MSDGIDRTTELSPPADERSPTAETETVVLPPAQPALRTQQIALIFLAVAAGSFLFGIVVATVTRPRTDQTVIVSQEVGPSGASIRFDGSEMRIPAGALEDDVRIVVRRSAVTDRIRVETAGDDPVVPPGRLAAYTFEPTNVTFRRPVEITFALPQGADNAAVFARRDNTVVLLTGTIDAQSGTATVAVRDFRFGGPRR